MGGPAISVSNSSVSRSDSISLLGGPDSSQVNPSAANQVANQPGVVAPAQQSQPSEVVGQPELNRKVLSEQISVLTEIASRARVSMPQSATALKEIESLSKKGTIPADTYSKLKKCSKEFVKSFEALSKMKVSDVREMFTSTEPTKCSKLFKAIDRCFGDIEDQLRPLLNNPESHSGNIERLQEDYALMYSRMRNAVMSCAEGDFDPKATLASVVNKVAASMNGTAGVLDAIKEEIAPVLTGLAKAGENSTDTIKVGNVIADAVQAIAVLERIKTDGVEIGDGKARPMQSDMDALIGTLRNAITNVRQQCAKHLGPGIEHAVKRLLIPNDLPNEFLVGEAKSFLSMEPDIWAILRTIKRCPNPIGGADKILDAAKVYTEPTDGKPGKSGVIKAIRDVNAFILSKVPVERINDALHRMRYIANSIDRRCREVEMYHAVQPGDNLNQMKMWGWLSGSTQDKIKKFMDSLYNLCRTLIQPGMMDDELNHLEQMVDIYNGKASGQIRQSDYKAMLEGNLDAGTVVLTYASGLNHRHIDKEVCNAEITKRKQLGQGAVNDVELLTCKGKDSAGQPITYQRVFKPAADARVGLYVINTAKAMGYNGTQNAVQTNVGAEYIAKKIGAKNVIAATRFGVINGVPGIVMDRAPGVKASECNSKYASKFSSLSPEKQATLRGNLMRELNRLQWADILSGQMDRHKNNYLVDIDFKKLTARVTGIDNDVCYGKNMVGMRKIRLSPEAFAKCFNEQERNSNQGIERIAEGNPPEVTGYICDATDLTPKMRRKFIELTGAHAMNIPDFIDAEIAREIENLDPEAYANDLREILQDEDSIQAALSRLQEVKAHVAKLAKEGKVIDEQSWMNPATQRQVVQAQKDQASRLLGTSQTPKKPTHTFTSAYEFFWRDLRFMAPKDWIKTK